MKRLKIVVLLFLLVGCSVNTPTEFSEKALQDELQKIAGGSVKLKDVLTSYKGKKVLINVWASWCKDCIIALPKMKKLQEQFPAVTYVFISADRSMDKWKRAIEKYGVVGEHYFMKEGMDSDFAAFLNSNWIPRYMVVNEIGFVDLFKAKTITDSRIVNALKK